MRNRFSRFLRTSALCTALALFFGLLAGCGPADAPASGSVGSAAGEAPVLSVTCTLFPLFDLVQQVGGSRVQTSLLVSAGQEAHGYAPTAADMQAASDADLLFYVGGHADEWVDGILDNVSVSTATLLGLLEDPDALPDDHVWTSPRQCLLLIDGIAGMLTDLDPDGAAVYAANADECRAAFAALDEGYAALGQAADRHILLADRQPFGCLTADYGLQFAAAFDGCSTDTEVSAARMAQLADLAAAESTPVIFSLELASTGLRDALAETAGARTGMLYSGQSRSAADEEAGLTLADMLAHNLTEMEAALA